MRTRFLLLLLMVGCCLPGRAQRTTPGTQIVVQPPQPPTCFLAPTPLAGSYRFRMDSLLTALNKAQVPTGILYDRVFPLARLDVFGQGVADTSRFAHFLQATQELWYASYTCTGLAASAGVRALAAAQQKAGVVPIGLLHYRFNLLDTLAVQHNLFTQPGGDGGALYDVAGRTQSPYLTRETLVADALVESVPAGTVQFKLPTSLRFDNTGNAVQSLTLNFNDGTPSATLLPGGAGTYKSYATAGEYIIQLVANFADGSSKATYTRLQVTGQAGLARDRDPNFPKIPTCIPLSDEQIPLTSSIAYTDYEGNTYAGVGQVTTYYANCNNRQLTKPVIILDGIDFGGPEQRFGVDVYSDFLNYYEGATPKRLGEELRAAGYDVVILDFPDANGAEYVQRNAFVLIQLIQNINADLRSRSSTPEQLTVIGPSMSGLVSRYALAYMEKKFNDASDLNTYQKPEWNHNTRLWMSFDSPQLGANIPIGDQQWLQYYAEVGEVEAAQNNVANLDRPATKEMLVHHYRSPNTTVSGAPGFRDRFQAELDNLGMPAQLRRIAVVNGSMAGTRQDWLNSSRKANGCDQAFRFQARTGSIRLFYIKFLTFNQFFPTILSNSLVNFSPDYGATCTTFIGETLTKSNWGRRTTGRQTSISYDVAPGSWRDTQATLAKEGTMTNERISGFFKNFFLGGFNRPSQTTEFYDVIDKHCFIPTVSALALTNPNRDLGQNLSTTDLVCTGETPFDSYFAPTQNEEHITITAANAVYIKNEILKKTPTPVFTAAPTAICPGTQATFSVANCPTRAGQPTTTYTWTAGGDLSIISGQGTSTVVVQAAANGASGSLQVVATRTGYQASAPAVVLPYIGNGYAHLDGPSGTKCYSEDFTYTLSNLVLAQAPVQWHAYLDGTLRDDLLGNRSATTAIVFPEAGTLSVTATLVSQCGGVAIVATSPYANVIEFTQNPHLEPCPIRQGRPASKAKPAAYPNPADDVLTLATPETKDAADPRTAVLYNGQGREVRRTRPGQVQLPTTDLPTGLYYLMVEQNGRVTRSQIRVQH